MKFALRLVLPACLAAAPPARSAFSAATETQEVRDGKTVERGALVEISPDWGRRDPGDSWQVFLDDEAVAAKSGVRQVVHSPERFAGHPLLPSDVPWENRGTRGGRVIYDPGTGWLHMYYKASGIPAGGKRVEHGAYARSRDGIHWERPELGLIDYPGVGTRNNLTPDLGSLDIDPHPASPDRRFVMLYEAPLPNGRDCVFSAASADGFHWKTVGQLGDLRKTAKRTAPTSHPRYIFIRQNWVTNDAQLGRRYRAAYRMESEDMVHWTGAAWALDSHAAHFNRDWEDYGMPIGLITEADRYHGLIVAFDWIFHTVPNVRILTGGMRTAGPVDTTVAISRDAVQWRRLGWPHPFLGRGKEGSWDIGSVYMSSMVPFKDRILFFYDGVNETHEHHLTFRQAIGLATLRRDGIASLEVEGREGAVDTKPMRVSGRRLQVNAEAAGGAIRVEVLDEAGKPVPGLAAADCRPLDGDGLDQEVSWAGKDLSGLAGRTVSLRFLLQSGAKLYAFRMAD